MFGPLSNIINTGIYIAKKEKVRAIVQFVRFVNVSSANKIRKKTVRINGQQVISREKTYRFDEKNAIPVENDRWRSDVKWSTNKNVRCQNRQSQTVTYSDLSKFEKRSHNVYPSQRLLCITRLSRELNFSEIYDRWIPKTLVKDHVNKLVRYNPSNIWIVPVTTKTSWNTHYSTHYYKRDSII